MNVKPKPHATVASIQGENIKTFVRLLQCAAKFGDELHLQVTKDNGITTGRWELSVTNSSKSAFCLFTLNSGFFCRRAFGEKVHGASKCSLLVKSVLAVLGKVAQLNQVNRLDLEIHDPSHDLRSRKRGGRSSSSSEDPSQRLYGQEDRYEDTGETRGNLTATFGIKLVCKHGVTKKHTLNLHASDFLRAEVDPDTTPSGFQIPTRTLRDWLDHFQMAVGNGPGSGAASFGRESAASGLNQLGWMFSKNEVRVKSWEGGSSSLSTEIKVHAEEFEEYEVCEHRVDLTLPMREFKATLVLAGQLSINLNVAFSVPTQPLTLTSYEDELDHCSIFCAIATTACDAFASVGTPSVDIKRSRSSDIGAAPASANGRKRHAGSEVPSQRKRPSLSLTREPEDGERMVTVVRSTSQPPQFNEGVSAGSFGGQHGHGHRSTESLDQRKGDSPSLPGHQDTTTEALFFPNSQEDLGSQPIRMTQREVLEKAGLGDIDELHMEEWLGPADVEGDAENNNRGEAAAKSSSQEQTRLEMETEPERPEREWQQHEEKFRATPFSHRQSQSAQSQGQMRTSDSSGPSRPDRVLDSRSDTTKPDMEVDEEADEDEPLRWNVEIDQMTRGEHMENPERSIINATALRAPSQPPQLEEERSAAAHGEVQERSRSDDGTHIEAEADRSADAQIDELDPSSEEETEVIEYDSTQSFPPDGRSFNAFFQD